MHPYNTVKLALGALLSLSAFVLAYDKPDFADSIKQSLVYLDISNSAYEQIQPWKQTPVSKEEGFAVAVAPDRVLTTAENVMYATYIQARVYDNNSYISARVVTVDYECNLCLLELDTDALDKPLSPVTFAQEFPKGELLTTYWLSAGNNVTTARSSLDRAEVENSDISFVKNLSFIVSNTSRPFGDGEICTWNEQVIGLAAWGNGSDAGIIPSETINRFLKQAAHRTYVGFGAPGFETYNLLDPTMRRYLKLPSDTQHGVYVSSVYTLGTGSTELKVGDVILSIDGRQLNPYGRCKHPQYDLISFHHLILQQSAGSVIPFEIVRDGKPLTLSVTARPVGADKMLVPYYQYGSQPRYYITGGYVFQQLTRDYLTMWGEGWPGKVPPHLFNYFFSESFKPSEKRSDIVVLSYVLPAEVNLGYQQLARLVVDKVNGHEITSMKDFVDRLQANTDQPFHEITFEMEAPVLVIPKANLALIDQQIAQLYGITKTSNIQ